MLTIQYQKAINTITITNSGSDKQQTTSSQCMGWKLKWRNWSQKVIYSKVTLFYSCDPWCDFKHFVSKHPVLATHVIRSIRLNRATSKQGAFITRSMATATDRLKYSNVYLGPRYVC